MSNTPKVYKIRNNDIKTRVDCRHTVEGEAKRVNWFVKKPLDIHIIHNCVLFIDQKGSRKLEKT
jgi:hypothetical protein